MTNGRIPAQKQKICEKSNENAINKGHNIRDEVFLGWAHQQI